MCWGHKALKCLESSELTDMFKKRKIHLDRVLCDDVGQGKVCVEFCRHERRTTQLQEWGGWGGSLSMAPVLNHTPHYSPWNQAGLLWPTWVKLLRWNETGSFLLHQKNAKWFLAWFWLSLQTPQKDMSHTGCYLINTVMLKGESRGGGEQRKEQPHENLTVSSWPQRHKSYLFNCQF